MGNEIVAYAGEVTLEKAIWDTVWGQYIQVRLEQRPHEKTTANPFKKFTKMRKGKVGTRFGAVFTCADGSTFYQDEVMLKHWGDGTTGWTLHLWINSDDETGRHPFMSCDAGDVFALAMVELADDNTAIDQVKRERVEKGPKTRHEMKLSNYAAMLCRLEAFWDYLDEHHHKFDDERKLGLENEAAAAKVMRDFLGIESRSELDTDAAVADHFHADIRRPYAKWVGARP